MAHDAKVQKTAGLVAVSEVMIMKEAIKHADIMTTSFGGGRLRSSFSLYLSFCPRAKKRRNCCGKIFCATIVAEKNVPESYYVTLRHNTGSGFQRPKLK